MNNTYKKITITTQEIFLLPHSLIKLSFLVPTLGTPYPLSSYVIIMYKNLLYLCFNTLQPDFDNAAAYEAPVPY